VTHRILTFIDVSASGWGTYKSSVTNTAASVADLAWPTVLLFVAAGLAGAVDTDFSLQTVSVRMTDLHTDRFQAFLTTGTVCIYFTLIMTHVSTTLMLRLTPTIGAA